MTAAQTYPRARLQLGVAAGSVGVVQILFDAADQLVEPDFGRVVSTAAKTFAMPRPGRMNSS